MKPFFFDWFNTLARYEPPREELHSQVLKQFGIEVSPQQIMPGLLIADRDFFEENIRSPMQKKSPEEQARVLTHYENTVLTEAGVKVDRGLLVKIMKKVQQLFEETITAGTIQMSNDTIEQATARIAEIKNSMDVCQKEIR